MILYYIMRGDGAAAKKKGWLKMRYNAMFFVCDENRNQISDEMLGETNDFTNYREAAAAAKKLSKKVSSLFKIDVCVPSVIFENGKEKQDY